MTRRWLLALACAGCLGKQQAFVCETDAACGAMGHCEATGFCSFDDSTCAMGRRYGELSSSLSNQCVGGQVPPDADLSCTCVGDTIHCAQGSDVTCPTGCLPRMDGGARCATPVPSNGLDKAWADEVALAISVSGATFDSDSGAITGSITRAAGEGVNAGIGFHRHTSMGVPIGVFVFASLQVPGTIRLTGTRAVAFLVAADVTIDGTIDGAGGCGGVRSCAGPGGGAGATTTAATGCGAGGNGTSDEPTTQNDAGGGGGGAGDAGGRGGDAGPTVGGAGGAVCIAPRLEPLIGGSGGGSGGGGSAAASEGGGGGGALQITALGALAVGGTIQMGGAGGAGGSPFATNAGAGAGGGSGGAILLEALTLSLSGRLVANGGGGGSGANGNNSGNPGAPGGVSTAQASGGASVNNNGVGGKGGARDGGAAPGQSLVGNGGGGGGAAGVIHLRAGSVPTLGGTISPAPTTGVVTAN